MLMTRFMVLMLTRAHANTAKTKAKAVIGHQMVILKFRRSSDPQSVPEGRRSKKFPIGCDTANEPA